MSTYLVTGCAGFLGSHLVDRLLAEQHDVVGIDVFTDYYDRARKAANLEGAMKSDTFVLREEDLVDADLDELNAGTAGVFHLAAQAGVRGSWGTTFGTYLHDNLLATQRVFEAAARSGVRVVWASSSSIYGNSESYPVVEPAPRRPVSPYGVTKVGCEYLADAYRSELGLDHVALRYFTVYGPRQRPDMAFSRLLAALRAGTEFTIFGDGSQSRDVTYVGDAVAATIAAMGRAPSGGIYNVGGGCETSLLEVISLAEELTGRRLNVTFAPVAVGDVTRTAADLSRAAAEMGWRPTVSLRDGLRAQIVAAGALSTAMDSVDEGQ